MTKRIHVQFEFEGWLEDIAGFPQRGDFIVIHRPDDRDRIKALVTSVTWEGTLPPAVVCVRPE